MGYRQQWYRIFSIFYVLFDVGRGVEWGEGGGGKCLVRPHFLIRLCFSVLNHCVCGIITRMVVYTGPD